MGRNEAMVNDPSPIVVLPSFRNVEIWAQGEEETILWSNVAKFQEGGR